MQFKTKDLLVNVLPAQFAERLCWLRTIICGLYPTRINCGFCSTYRSICQYCSLQATVVGCHGNSCGFGGSACDPTIFCAGASVDPFVIQNLEDLATLKAELQDTIKSLDALQKEGLPSSIGSKSEADALERGLTEALAQVRAAKKKL
jgi:hypothetical protein